MSLATHCQILGLPQFLQIQLSNPVTPEQRKMDIPRTELGLVGHPKKRGGERLKWQEMRWKMD